MLDAHGDSDTQVVMPVSDLHGRTIWTEDGRRLGTIRDVNTDEAGRIESFDVRERWMLGPHHEVPAVGMRLDDGDVVVPSSASSVESRRRRDGREDERPAHGGVASGPAPVLLAGRAGARSRYGGLDLLASLFGALVTIAAITLIGGILGAAFGSEPANLDTSVSEASALATEALLIGAVTLFLASLVGGWCAGRSARFDGMRNGVMSVVWVVAIVAALGGLGAWLGDQYDVLAGVDLPSVDTGQFALWGVVGLVAALALMMLGAALGGRIGESWHRRADRSMLDVVPMHEGAAPSVTSSPRVPTQSASREREEDRHHHRDDEDLRPL